MPRNAVKPSSVRRKLQMEEEDGLSSQGNSSDGKRCRGNDNEPRASLKRRKRSSAHKFDEVLAQANLQDKAMGTLQPAVDDPKLNPDGGGKVRRSKRFESRSPRNSPVSLRRWSGDQEMCLMNAILDTRTPHGEINRAAFYQRAREQLRLEVSNSKLYEKMKSMKKKFWSMVKERKEGKLAIQTAHEQTMFLLWEKLWGTMETEHPKPMESERPDHEGKVTECPNPTSSSVQNSEDLDLEEVTAQSYLKAKTMGASQVAVDDANLSPDGGSDVRTSKRFKSRSQRKSPIFFEKWSDDHEMSPTDATLDTRKTQGEDKTMWALQPAVDDAKLSPDGGREVRRSKRFESMSPRKSQVSIRKWSGDQEMCLMNAILDTRTPHGEINRLAFYQRAREQLRLEVSNSKLYEKMRRMKKRFWSMVKERKEGKLAIQTVHEHTMFLLWEKLWGTIEAEKANPEEKEPESSSPNEIEAENSNPLGAEILNPNSAENSSSPREDTLNPNSPKNLKNRENMAINTSFAEGSEFRENSAINPIYAVNLDFTVDLNSDVNPNFAANLKHMENKAKRCLREETHGENANPNFTASPKHMENKAKGSLREETHGENTHLLEESIHQEIHMENARVNGLFVDKSPHPEIHVGNARGTGHAVDGSGLKQTEFRGLESRIEALIESSIKGIETRLEAAVQNSVSCVVTAAGTANFKSLEEFCGEVRKGNDALSNVSRTLKDLMHGVDSVEEFPSLDVAEAGQLQQQWHKIRLQQLKTFSEGLELLNNQCKLFMKSVETENENNGS